MREKLHQAVGENIFSTQEKQRFDYSRHYEAPNKIKEDQKVLFKNQRMMDRNGVKF